MDVASHATVQLIYLYIWYYLGFLKDTRQFSNRCSMHPNEIICHASMSHYFTENAVFSGSKFIYGSWQEPSFKVASLFKKVAILLIKSRFSFEEALFISKKYQFVENMFCKQPVFVLGLHYSQYFNELSARWLQEV